ncbi:MAG: PorT family protein [Bacteroidaceae bacterium]|nr:PorT family protein [Bacteroidaceae bacterium]
MKKLFVLLVPVLVALSSCTTVNKTAKTADISASIRNASVADLDVAPRRVTYTMTPSKAVRRGGLANIKRVAESEALEKNGGGDVLVNPEFTVTKRRGLFSSKVTSVTVTGRPANYTHVRSLPDSVWCNPVFRGVPQYSHSTHTDGVSSRSKTVKKEPLSAAVPQKKWTHMLRVGFGANTFSINSDFEDRMEARVGFTASYEANRAIGRKGAYYGFDVTIGSRGYSIDTDGMYVSYEDEKKFDQLVPGIHVTPLILGWKFNVAKNVALDPHFGVYLGGDFSTDDTLLDWAFDSGWKLGIGVWFKRKFALDFTYQGGFVDHEAEWGYDYANLGHTSNSMVRLTYAF